VPQIATTDDKKPTEKGVSPGVHIAATADEMAHTTPKPGTQASHRTAWVTDPLGSKAAPEGFGAFASRSPFAVFSVGSNIGAFWFSLAQAQLAANVETIRKLAVTRDWRERLEIRSSFVRDNLARMSEGVTRSAELANELVSNVRR
jgi:hypothetical protein